MMMQCNKTFVAYHYYNLQLHEYCSILLLLSCKPYIVVVPYQRIEVHPQLECHATTVHLAPT